MRCTVVMVRFTSNKTNVYLRSLYYFPDYFESVTSSKLVFPRSDRHWTSLTLNNPRTLVINTDFSVKDGLTSYPRHGRDNSANFNTLGSC